jgi:competence protein ComEC
MAARILWAVVLGFFAGVFLRSVALVSWPFAGLFLLLAALVLAFAFFDTSKRGVTVVFAMLLVAAATGVVRMDVATQEGDPQLTAHLGREVVLEGFVAEEPDARERSTRITLQVGSILYDRATSSVSGRVLAVAPAHTDVAYGAHVRASGLLALPEAFDTDGGRAFDYPMYLAKDGVLYTLSFAEVERLEGWRGNPAKAFALGVKHVLTDGLHSALPEPEAGLAAGITLGDKRAVGGELSDVFIRASLIHIVVLSGYNITIVINAAGKMLQWFPRALRFGGSGVVVVFFVLMTGGAPTAVRAGLMALIAVYARLSGRTFIATRALAAASFLMVLWNPYTLLFDPGFQLSALATLGLILFTPYFFARLAWVPKKLQLREIFASTLATQLTVLPLLLYQSGNLSLVALPANLFALVAIPPAMALSALAALAGALVGPYAVFVGFPAYVLLAYVIKVAEFFAALPLAAVTVPAFSAWLLALAYGTLFGIYALYKKRAVEG